MGFLFGKSYQDPSAAAQPYLNQIPATITPYYQPYIDTGQQAGGVLSDQYGRMSTDPMGYYNEIMGGYTESPGAQYQQEQMQKQMSANAAAGGFTGTEYDQQRQAEALSGILSQDQQRYYQDVTGAQQYGLGGEQSLYNTGYGASSSLANALGSNLAAQAGLAYQGVAGENAYNQARHNAMLGLLGTGMGAGAGYYGSRSQSSPHSSYGAQGASFNYNPYDPFGIMSPIG